MILVTGATGKLGQLVITELLKTTPPQQIIAAVRNPEKAQALKAKGVHVRQADYDQPTSWAAALQGVERVLLISSSEVGKRAVQHQAVIDAVKRAGGIKLLAYTSILRADTSSLGLASEHLTTEKALKASQIPHTLLRNGWYTENHTENLASALQHGVILGAAQKGRFASATRADFAAAAAAVIGAKDVSKHAGKIYELVGDQAFTLSELAVAVSKASGKAVKYQDMPEAEYAKTLEGFGLPAPFAHLLADSDSGAARGDLMSDSRDLHQLIGRATTSLEHALQSALKA